jgi:hypothetical protein
MPFGSSYGDRQRLVDVKPGGGCPRCGKQTVQVEVYEDAKGNKTFKNKCRNCTYEERLS